MDKCKRKEREEEEKERKLNVKALESDKSGQKLQCIDTWKKGTVLEEFSGFMACHLKADLNWQWIAQFKIS